MNAARWRARIAIAHAAFAMSVGAVAEGPFDIELLNTPTAPAASGHARLVFATSPFGVAVTADGRASYDVQINLANLPAPATLGAFSTYVAWAVTTDLSEWHKLGAVTNGTNVVGQADYNKFLLVISAEANAQATAHAGPTVLHGTSPSGWLQSFLSHPLFRGLPP
ncbi:MAG: hypothetical protein ABI625_17175 [bacterium]